MVCQPDLVQWLGWHLRSFLSGSSAMARCCAEPSAPEGYGSSDDLLQPTELLLCGWNVGYVLDRMDLGQHRLGYASEEKPAGPAKLQRGSRCLGKGRGNDDEYSSPSWSKASAAGRALLLRLAATSARRCVVELERIARQVFSNKRRSPEPFGVVRR